jgi:Ca2+-binding RTX toxin-like protein
VDRLQEVGDADIVLTDTALTGLGGEAFPSSTFEEAALTGGPGANLIDATAFSGPTTLDGAGGKDTVLGGADPDALTGGTGDDSLDGSGGLDRLAEAADVDLTLGPGSLTGLGTDVLGSIEEADLSGGAGPNALNAAAFDGPVTLGGGGGDDTLTAGPGDDTLDGEGGTDLLKEAGDASFTLTDAALTGGSVDALSGLERAFLTGGPGNNSLDTSAFTGSVTLDGAEGNDTLVAGPAADSILGRAGNDRMTGGKGPDRLLGHAGNDRFKARDGVKDLIKGGGGNKDSARTDRKDKVRGVEQRR